jgi:hypothetical protein
MYDTRCWGEFIEKLPILVMIEKDKYIAKKLLERVEEEWEKYPMEEEDKKWREQWMKNWKKEPKIDSPSQKAEQTYKNIKEFLLDIIG